MAGKIVGAAKAGNQADVYTSSGYSGQLDTVSALTPLI